MSMGKKDGKNLTEWEAKKELSDFGIPTVKEDLAKTPEQAEEIAGRIGLPVVLKVESSNIQHKTDAGGVKKVHSLEKIREAFENIEKSVKKYKEDADFRGVLVEEVLEGDEFIIGISPDPQFGKVLMFGLGGIYTEVFKDISIRPLPVEKKDIKEMIGEIKSKELLEGVRGRSEADKKKLVDVIMKVAEFAEERNVQELDINPLFVNGEKITAADALVTLEG